MTPWKLLEACGPLPRGRYLVDTTDAEILTAHWDPTTKIFLDLDRPSNSVIVNVAQVYRPDDGPIEDAPET